MRPSRAAILTAVLAVAGCAAAGPAPRSSVPLTAGTGTVLTVRAIVSDRVDDGPLRAALLDGATGLPTGAGPAGPTRAEFIIREDSGPTVSIVQTNAEGLHPGDRVQITRPTAATGRLGLTHLL